jgi:hypothetical protein
LVKAQDGSLVSKFITDVSEAVKDVTTAKVEKKSKEFAKKSGSAEKEVDIAKPESGKPMSVLPKKKEDPKKNQSDFSEAHKLGDKVIMTGGPADVKGKTGRIGEIRKRWTGDTKTYTIDHDKGSIQLKPKHFKAFKEHIEKVKGGYEVESEHGNKNLGKSKSLAGAKKRLKQVEYFKHMNEEHDDQYELANGFKAAAEHSMSKGNMGGYHAHMANHHDHMGQWHEKKGRSAAADKEYEKAEHHHAETMKHPYISEETINETFSSIEHNTDHKKISHGADYELMIGKEHHDKISKLEHGDRHVFKCKAGNEYGCWRNGDNLNFKRHSQDSGLYSNMHITIPVAQWNNQDAMGQDKPVTEETITEDHVEFRVDHRDSPKGDLKHTMAAHGASVSDVSDKATYFKVPKHKADSFKTTMKAQHGVHAELAEARMSAAVKLQRAFQREQEKSEASRKRAEELLKPKKPEPVKEDVYSSDTKIKKVQVQDKDGNWVFKDHKYHPHKVDFKNSKMNAKPAEPVDPTKIDTETAYQDFMDKKKKQNEAWVLNPSGKTKKKYKDIKDNKTLETSSGAGTTFDPFSDTSTK